jgi:hypothetical protein
MLLHIVVLRRYGTAPENLNTILNSIAETIEGSRHEKCGRRKQALKAAIYNDKEVDAYS